MKGFFAWLLSIIRGIRGPLPTYPDPREREEDRDTNPEPTIVVSDSVVDVPAYPDPRKPDDA